MVAVQSRLDDVLLATKGKKVEATRRVHRTIPAKCSPTGKSQRYTFDVSDEGERELERLDQQYNKRLEQAAQVYQKVSPEVAKERLNPTEKKSKAKEEPTPSAEAQDDKGTHEPEGGGEQDDQSAAEGGPAAPAFGGSFHR